MSETQFGICPYNPDHRIAIFRMPKHIVKCMKNYQGPPLKICKYNATHRVLDMEEHLKECLYYRRFMDNQCLEIALTTRIAPTQEDGRSVSTPL
ncbi:hypothetical protein KR032_012325 [Drosophila birchii]|nr:hypothetical protein KR032_012325 [Drosophila birchii]